MGKHQSVAHRTKYCLLWPCLDNRCHTGACQCHVVVRIRVRVRVRVRVKVSVRVRAPVVPVACQVIHEPCIDQFREFESLRVLV